MDTTPDPLDGNALAGPLAELFAVELTAAITTCGSCGDTRRLAELVAWVDGPGAVLRCASCTAVLVRLVRGPGRAWLDLSGTQVLEVAVGDGPP